MTSKISSVTDEKKQTPLMQQYFEIKHAYPDTLVLFQVGDFYELFFEDAKQAASFLGIALTARGKNQGEPIPLCGVPVHALDHYLNKLVKGGFKVAICDQLEEAKPGTIVRRGVKQVLTPGTLTDAKLLDERSASYLFSFYPMHDSWGLVFTELLTAQIFVTTIELSEKLLEAELIRFFPDEILLAPTKEAKEFQAYFKKLGYCTTIVHAEDTLSHDDLSIWMNKHFDQKTIERICHHESMKLAFYYFYAYMSKNQRSSLDIFSNVFFYQPDDFLILDTATQRNLELIKNLQDGSAKNTLFQIMDCAKTAMGSRMIKKWIQRPLVKKDAIMQRQDVIALFCKDILLFQTIQQLLSRMGDLERVVGRIALERAHQIDFIVLSRALMHIPAFKEALECGKITCPLIDVIMQHLGSFESLSDVLMKALDDQMETIIRQGFDEKLDRMRHLVQDSNQAVIALERKEQQATGINSLKIRYNNIQGYYIEITNTHLDAVPDRYKRLQTLVGRERFITPELQQLQYEIEMSRKDSALYEQELYKQIKAYVMQHISALRKCAHAIAHLDALIALADLAYNNNYVRPVFNNERNIIIMHGRHPVVEQTLSTPFVVNDTHLTHEQSLWIITGPNMGGKSTYLRQVALISIMAHIGSFVPARSADIALLDRIFTRLGASDNVAQGKSTFLVEMEETATICTQATEKSLVILDEVGRGTSTFDGLAIAQSVVEYILTHIKARCLFATHYHELTHLPNMFAGVVPYYAASKKTSSGIVFLYKIIRGVADGSFGIDVARLADLPSEVIERAVQLVDTFAQGNHSLIPAVRARESTVNNVYDEKYRHLAEEKRRLEAEISALNTVMQHINSIDFDTLSPKKAFDLLWDLKKE